MSDPISNNQNRLSSAAAANRTTLEKLDRKTPPAKADNAQETKAPARTQGSDSVNLSNVKERIDETKTGLEPVILPLKGAFSYTLHGFTIFKNWVD